METYKIYKKGSILRIERIDRRQIWSGLTSDVLIDKNNLGKPIYRFFNVKDWTDRWGISISQLFKEDGSPYTEVEFDFFIENTGFNGGGTAPNDVWQAQVYENRTAVIYENKLYILASSVTLPFNSTDFATELVSGSWVEVIPDASETVGGKISTGTQQLKGNKSLKGESPTTGSVLSLLNSDSSKLVANFQNNGNSTFLNVITKGLTVADTSDIWAYWTRTGGATVLNKITGSRAQIGTFTNHELYFITNNVDRIKILNDGKVGIGTALSPQGILDVESTTIGSLPVPRMTEAERLAIVQYRDGMFAYQTDAGTFGQGLYIYISSLGWKKVTVS